MSLFTFDPNTCAREFQENGFVHIKHGVSYAFLEFARAQLAQCLGNADRELTAREIKSKKKQYLFALPKDKDFLRGLLQTIGTVTAASSSQLTLSERHLMVYDDNAVALPPLHKDRAASRFSVGIPLESSTNERVALLLHGPDGINVLDSAVYCPRVVSSDSRSADGWNLSEADYPEAPTGKKPVLVELAMEPGDVLIFAGSSMYHGRLNAAGSSILYFKLSDLGLDPLGEDPMTVELRESTLKIVSSKSDDELLESVVELSPRLQHVGRQYTRLDWTTVLRANVSGEKEFIISDDDWSFISALRGRRKVKDVLIEVEPRQDRRLCSIRGIRRLAKLGAIELLP